MTGDAAASPSVTRSVTHESVAGKRVGENDDAGTLEKVFSVFGLNLRQAPLIKERPGMTRGGSCRQGGRQTSDLPSGISWVRVSTSGSADGNDGDLHGNGAGHAL